ENRISNKFYFEYTLRRAQMLNLEGKIAIITGGSKGIGKETALTFIQQGAKVVIADVDEKAGNQLIKDVNDKDKVIFVKTNVADSSQVQKLVKINLENYERIDILVNNAGITIDGLLSKMEDTNWQKVIDINLTGVYNCTKAVVDQMKSQKCGVILNASSVIGIYGNVGQTN